MFLRIIVFVFSFFSVSPTVLAKSTTGNNNGDAIRILFTEARLESIAMIEHFDANGKGSLFSPHVISFITSHRDDITSELRQLKLEWTDEKTGACAHTESFRGAPVYLSFSACGATTKSLDDAIKTILHETTHHFGYGSSAQDEAFADELALTVFAMDRRALANAPEIPVIGKSAETPEEARRLWTESCEDLRTRLVQLMGHERVSEFACGAPNSDFQSLQVTSEATMKIRLGTKPLQSVSLTPAKGVHADSDEYLANHSWQEECFALLENAKKFYGTRFVAGHCGESSRGWSFTFADTFNMSWYTSEPKIWVLPP